MQGRGRRHGRPSTWLRRPGCFVPCSRCALGHKLVFAAYTEREGQELWVSDRSHRGAHIIESIAPGHRRPGIEDLTSAGDMAFFSVACRNLRQRRGMRRSGQPPPLGDRRHRPRHAPRAGRRGAEHPGRQPARGRPSLALRADRLRGGRADGLDRRRDRGRSHAPRGGRSRARGRHAPAAGGGRKGLLRLYRRPRDLPVVAKRPRRRRRATARGPLPAEAGPVRRPRSGADRNDGAAAPERGPRRPRAHRPRQPRRRTRPDRGDRGGGTPRVHLDPERDLAGRRPARR